MKIQKNISLSDYSTMRVGGNAAYLAEVYDKFDIPKLVTAAGEQNVPVIMIGGGSNIVWKDEGFAGLVIVNKISGFETQEFDKDTVYVTVGAGEDWDSVVKRCVEQGLNGIAELSLIPGSAGATPVQNVGAYGQEISNVLVTVEAYDTKEQTFTTIPASDCEFGYRTSRFKTTDKGRFLISGITMVLNRNEPTPPFYDAVTQYLQDHQVLQPTLQDVRDAVVAIRSAKLPDPKTVANNGSFFANPIIAPNELPTIQLTNPDIKYWRTDDEKIKLSAAWMIEAAGFKDAHDPETGMATWAHQPLVLVNESAKSTADVLAFKQQIVDAVATKFGVTLQQEPELLP